jgi:ABC-type phosphate/phosphonate transport system substrate-binding protein
MGRTVNRNFQGLVIVTSKFTGEPSQRTLLVVREDDPANSIEDLAGSTYGYMKRFCSSSYFPPAMMLKNRGQNLNDFFKMVEVPGWQNRVHEVVAKKIRSTMILEKVWKMTPSNEQTCKIIGQVDHCPRVFDRWQIPTESSSRLSFDGNFSCNHLFIRFANERYRFNPYS